jgi:ATP-dependent HslUV protease ATP-binding subunit HslU
VELQDLTKDDFVRILHEPRNSLIKQQVALLGTEGVSVVFNEDAIDAMAQIAYDLNRRTQNIGARRLYTILERVVEKISFEGSDVGEKRIEISADYVRERLKDVLGDEDLSKFIL